MTYKINIFREGNAGGAAGSAPVAEDARMDFLTAHFTLLGVDFQYWMPVAIVALMLYIFYLWRSGKT
jgi:hypothetical protein